jgi:hypothetical protein
VGTEVVAGLGNNQVAEDLPDAVLEQRICSLAGRLAAATYTWLVLIAEFDRRVGWSGWGVKSCAHWLAWSCSMSPAAAREHVRVARALGGLPMVSAGFAAGSLSYSKVRALTRVTSSVDEATLVRLAEVETASQLERTVRGFRKANGAGLGQQRKRKARVWWDEDGMLVMSARLPADEGALLMAALAAAEATADAPADTADRIREDREADLLDIDYRAMSVADSLVVMATTALHALPADDSGEDRHLVVLHVDTDHLAQVPSPVAEPEPTEPEPTDPEPTVQEPTEPKALESCTASEPAEVLRRVEGGPGVDRSTSERIACDAMVVAIVQSTVTGTLNAGRRTRNISAALRRALGARDGGCQFPGCHRRTHLEAHHIQHWYHGGPTDLHNLVLLCRFHHMVLHEAGFSLAVTNAVGARLDLEFRKPDGTPIPQSPPLDPGSSLDLDVSDVDPSQIKPKQYGEPFSLSDAVGVLVA